MSGQMRTIISSIRVSIPKGGEAPKFKDTDICGGLFEGQAPVELEASNCIFNHCYFDNVEPIGATGFYKCHCSDRTKWHGETPEIAKEYTRGQL